MPPLMSGISILIGDNIMRVRKIDRIVCRLLKKWGVSYQPEHLDSIRGCGDALRNMYFDRFKIKFSTAQCVEQFPHTIFAFTDRDYRDDARRGRTFANRYPPRGWPVLRYLANDATHIIRDCQEMGLPEPRIISIEQHCIDSNCDVSSSRVEGDTVYMFYPTSAAILYYQFQNAKMGRLNYQQFCDKYNYSEDMESRDTYMKNVQRLERLHRIFSNTQIKQLEDLLRKY